MKISFPKTVDFALTGRCNLRCKHCNTSDTWDLKKELSFDQIIDVLDQLRENKLFNLNLFGGEPFCHPRIFEIFEALNQYPIRITILTNGTLIDEKAVKEIKKMRFLSNVQISIDGSNAETHDWQRGEGSFEKSVNAVKLLLKENVPVSIKAVINSNTCDDIENMVKLAIGFGLSNMDFGDAVECGRASFYASDMRFEGRMHRRLMKTMFDLEKKYPDFGFGGTLAQKKDMLRDFYRNGPGGGSRGTFHYCPAGQDMLSIRSDGKVVPCSAWWTFICGDVKKNTLYDIWQNSERLNEIRAMAEEPITEHNEKCNTCDYLSYCNGGCRASAYYITKGDMRGIDPNTCLVFSDQYGFRLDKKDLETEGGSLSDASGRK